MFQTVEKLTADDFESSLGTRFRLLAPSPTLEVELIEVRRMKHSDPSGPFRAPFYLLLRADSATALPQGIYPLESERYGKLELFLVPSRLDASGCYYCVTFS